MDSKKSLHLERATSFLSEQPCTKLESLQLKLCPDVGASEPPKHCYLVLKPLIGVGDIDIVYALHDPASESMMERIAEELGDALEPEDEEYEYYFGAALARVWRNAPIGIALPEAKNFVSLLDFQAFSSTAKLAAVEFPVMVHCASAGYRSVLDEMLPLGSLVEKSILEEACNLASGMSLPRREFT